MWRPVSVLFILFPEAVFVASKSNTHAVLFFTTVDDDVEQELQGKNQGKDEGKEWREKQENDNFCSSVCPDEG